MNARIRGYLFAALTARVRIASIFALTVVACLCTWRVAYSMPEARSGMCLATVVQTWNTLRDEVPRKATQGFFYQTNGLRLMTLDTCSLAQVQPDPLASAERLYGRPNQPPRVPPAE